MLVGSGALETTGEKGYGKKVVVKHPWVTRFLERGYEGTDGAKGHDAKVVEHGEVPFA